MFISLSFSLLEFLFVFFKTYIIIPGGHDTHHPRLDHILNGMVHGPRKAPPQGHVHDGPAAHLLPRDVLHDELQAGQDGRVGARALRVEDLDGGDVCSFGDAKGCTGYGAGDVAAVAVVVVCIPLGLTSQLCVSSVRYKHSDDDDDDDDNDNDNAYAWLAVGSHVSKVGPMACPALEFDVRDADTRVDDVDRHALPRGLVKEIRRLAGPRLREALQSRGCICLGDGRGGVNPLIGLDVGDLVGAVDVGNHGVVGVEGHGAPRVHLEGHDVGGQLSALGASLVQAQVAFPEGRGIEGHAGVNVIAAERVVVHDNVPVGDDVGGWAIGDGDDGIRRKRTGPGRNSGGVLRAE